MNSKQINQFYFYSLFISGESIEIFFGFTNNICNCNWIVAIDSNVVAFAAIQFDIFRPGQEEFLLFQISFEKIANGRLFVACDRSKVTTQFEKEDVTVGVTAGD